MQTVIELPLKRPFELGMVEIPRMHFKEICVHRHSAVFQLNRDFDAFSFDGRPKIQERMFVKTQLRQHTFQGGGRRFGHTAIKTQQGLGEASETVYSCAGLPWNSLLVPGIIK